jgi:hypothetical protein
LNSKTGSVDRCPFYYLSRQAAGGTGCLAGMLSAERPNLPEQIAEKVRAIFQDWEQAFYDFFRQGMDEQRGAFGCGR